MQDLTTAEEHIMNCIWKLGDNVRTSDIMKCLKEDYGKEYVNSTLCVFMSYLRKKEWVGYRKKGNSYVYYPLITRQDYRKQQIERLLDGCFEGSLVSFFEAIIRNATKEEKKEIAELLCTQDQENGQPE